MQMGICDIISPIKVSNIRNIQRHTFKNHSSFDFLGFSPALHSQQFRRDVNAA